MRRGNLVPGASFRPRRRGPPSVQSGERDQIEEPKIQGDIAPNQKELPYLTGLDSGSRQLVYADDAAHLGPAGRSEETADCLEERREEIAERIPGFDEGILCRIGDDLARRGDAKLL